MRKRPRSSAHTTGSRAAAGLLMRVLFTVIGSISPRIACLYALFGAAAPS
ncbi:hypothetical protein ABZ611_33920 [Streptomyces sp. NPDC007861]